MANMQKEINEVFKRNRLSANVTMVNNESNLGNLNDSVSGIALIKADE